MHILNILAVDPVVQGKTRAEQFYRGDNEGREVVLRHIKHKQVSCGGTRSKARVEAAYS